MVTSRAAVMEAPGRIGVREFPVSDPGPGAVLLKMSLSGICGTDKHTYRGESGSTSAPRTNGRSPTR